MTFFFNRNRINDAVEEWRSIADAVLIRKGETTLEELAAHAADLKAPKVPASRRQEYLEGVLNNIILS